jgi:AraC family transcriptional regulator
MIVLDNGLYLGNVKKAISIEGLKINYTTYKKDKSFETMHSHANPHFSFVLSGGNLEKRKNRELQRLPGKLTFYHSDELHQNIYAMSGSGHLNIEFEPEFFVRHDINETTLSAISDNDPSSKFSLLKVYKELFIRDDVSEINAHSILLDLVQKCRLPFRQKPVWIEKLDHYLRGHLDETLSLNLLSAEIGVHPITISKHFPKYFSCTLGEYIRKLRTERAIQLIKASSLSLTAVGTSCGFTDQSHFIRNFKSYTSFLPKEFRDS